MNKILTSTTTQAKAAVAALFDTTPPVLVEVRFGSSGTSPDWHLFEEEEQLEALLERLGPGTELYLSSVWDLKNTKGEVCLRK